MEEIASKENLQIEPGALAVIARMAEGSLRDALSLLEQARAYCGESIPADQVRALLGVVPDDALEELVGAIAAGSADRALALVHTFQKEGRNLQHFCREAIRHMRNLLIARVCGAESDLIAATPDQRPALARAAAEFSEEDLTRFFQILLQTDDDLRHAPQRARNEIAVRVGLEQGNIIDVGVSEIDAEDIARLRLYHRPRGHAADLDIVTGAEFSISAEIAVGDQPAGGILSWKVFLFVRNRRKEAAELAFEDASQRVSCF